MGDMGAMGMGTAPRGGGAIDARDVAAMVALPPVGTQDGCCIRNRPSTVMPPEQSGHPSDPSLDTLLRQTAQGDRAAFESLYHASAPRLMAIALRVLRDRHDAEDLLQEVYVTIWNKAGQFDAQRASAQAWLSTIARNRAIDRLRGQAGQRTVDGTDLEQWPDEGTGPQDLAARSAERARLDLCLDGLEPKRRRLIRSAFLDGFTYDELARAIGAPLGSVKSWIRRGLQQLKTCLEA